MKFGVFLPNGSNGYLITKAIPPYLPTWELNREVTLEAERQGLDFVLSMMKFRGFGGETGFWDACMESFTLMASLASVTDRIGLIPTTTILALHPAYVARMMATLDDVSGGRIGLNIVTGWNKPEYKQMGLWRGDAYYEQRYEYALEYVEILRALWRDGRATHRSRVFDLEDCSCLPTPEHEIPIISAGMSNAGRQFVADVGGHNFVMAPPERVHALAADLRELGSRSGRDVATYALLHLIAEETDDKAEQLCRDIVSGGDLEAIQTMIASAQMDTVQDGTTHQLRQSAAEELLGGDPEEANMAFMGFPAIVGSFESVARKIDALAADSNVEGLLFSWPDWISGIRNFGERVIPLLECRKGWDPQRDGGLRGLGRRQKI
jgi:pyrimidine oxygenase